MKRTVSPCCERVTSAKGTDLLSLPARCSHQFVKGESCLSCLSGCCLPRGNHNWLVLPLVLHCAGGLGLQGLACPSRRSTWCTTHFHKNYGYYKNFKYLRPLSNCSAIAPIFASFSLSSSFSPQQWQRVGNQPVLLLMEMAGWREKHWCIQLFVALA